MGCIRLECADWDGLFQLTSLAAGLKEPASRTPMPIVWALSCLSFAMGAYLTLPESSEPAGLRGHEKTISTVALCVCLFRKARQLSPGFGGAFLFSVISGKCHIANLLEDIFPCRFRGSSHTSIQIPSHSQVWKHPYLAAGLDV